MVRSCADPIITGLARTVGTSGIPEVYPDFGYVEGMVTGRNSRATRELVALLSRRGVTITGKQVERWTAARLAPDVRLPLREAVTGYYAELAFLIRRGEQTTGTLTVMAFRGYAHLIDVDHFHTDLLALLPIHPTTMGGDELADAINRTTRRTLDNTRARNNPTRMEAITALRQLPTTVDGDRPAVIICDEIGQLRAGNPIQEPTSIVEIVANALPNPPLEDTLGPPTPNDLADAAGMLREVDFAGIREAVMRFPVDTIVRAAHLVYPIQTFIATLLGPANDRVCDEKTAMIAATGLLHYLPPAQWKLLASVATMLAQRTGLRVQM